MVDGLVENVDFVGVGLHNELAAMHTIKLKPHHRRVAGYLFHHSVSQSVAVTTYLDCAPEEIPPFTAH
jgi:hypothetical protein